MKNFILILGILVNYLSCNSISAPELKLPFYNQADFTPEWIDEADPRYQDIHQVGKFSFVNQNGNTITEETFHDKIYVANFFFTICPGVCPRMTANLQTVQEAFENDESLKIISHTVMPWEDSVATLKRYEKTKGINGRQWNLVTGEKAALYEAARKYYFADEGFGKSVTIESDFLHTENILLIDKQRRIRGVYNGTLPLEMQRLIEDIKTLKKEG